MKPLVLIVSPYYHPGRDAGGPVKSLKNLSRLLLGEDRAVRVITKDRDVGAAIPFTGVARDGWNPTEYGRVYYSASFKSTALALRQECRGGAAHGPILYLNSFFSFRFSILPVVMARLGAIAPRRIVNAPRGEFASGALAHKPWRKRVYLAIARAFGLYRGVTWHATNEEEAGAVRRLFGASARVRVATNLSAGPEAAAGARAKTAGEIAIAFVARVVPIKNLRFALEALRDVKAAVRFDIFGPREDAAYCRECEQVIASLPPHVVVNWMGPVDNDRVGEVLAERDLLLLPTLGENFGHAIVEAMQSGCAPLISDQTPWRGLEAAGAGWDLPLGDARRFTAAIEAAAALGPADAELLRRNARAYVRSHPLLMGAVEATRPLFE
jgi:glycosyltransferase involved in cell wall biosynthesis